MRQNHSSDPARAAGLTAVLTGALAGLLAAGAALAVAEPVAALVGGRSAPLIAVGSTFIDLTPEWLKSFAIRTFGANDKTVLLAGIGVVATLLAAAIGLLARRNRRRGALALLGFGAIGVIAALSGPDAGPADALPSIIGAAVGALILVYLSGLSRAAAPAPVPAPAPEPAPAPDPDLEPASAPDRDPDLETDPDLDLDPEPPTVRTPESTSEPAERSPAAAPGPERRAFLVASAGTAVAAGAAVVLGRSLRGAEKVEAARGAVQADLPRPARPAGALPAGTDLRVPGLSPFMTPNGDFYRVDTTLVLPRVDPAGWTLRVHGMVDRPIELSFDDLLRRPLIEHDVTLACVSNDVGGEYVGNARWLGASLAGVLREAGIKAGADQILSRSADGWTCGTPVDTVMDGRDALLAVAMNGEPLPVAHGFPARMVVPGLYGYVSATKWVVDLELTRFTDSKAYWTTRGWAERAPVKTMARIDLPRGTQRVKAGRVPIAGVAWAQHRGISAVEVRVGKGAWRQARLAPVPGTDTWRQWVLEWDATPGTHRIEVRATDGTGATQPGTYAPPAPDGATGWHSVEVTVEA